MAAFDTYDSHSALLIEPVWNRNPYDALRDYKGYTFNLLIEPVWNRNSRRGEGTYYTKSLLIEPVWNRNVVRSRTRTR